MSWGGYEFGDLRTEEWIDCIVNGSDKSNVDALADVETPATRRPRLELSVIAFYAIALNAA
jgi:hypothetical protein